VPPGRHQLGLPERNSAVLLVDDGLEHVIGLSVEHNRWAGDRLDADLVKLFFAATDQFGQLMRQQRGLDIVFESMSRAHIAKQHMACLCGLF